MLSRAAVRREIPQSPTVRGGVRFGKVHDLVALLEIVLPVEPSWERFREDLAYLSDFAVSFRYPGESADQESASDAQKRCRAFRQVARKALGLEVA